jgi:hypothetical protein
MFSVISVCRAGPIPLPPLVSGDPAGAATSIRY